MQRLSLVGKRLAWIAFAGAVVGCGSDSTGPKGGQSTLTTQQATLVATGIFEELSLALGKSGFSGQAAPIAARLSSVPITGTASINAPCTNGGNITGTYNYSDDIGSNGSGTASGAMTVVMAGCKVSTGTDLIAVSGNLTYTFSFVFSQQASLDTFDWRGTGSFNWTGGSCGIDYTVHYTGATGGQFVIKGTVCGVNVSQTA
jgi:hypothetical protein